MPPLTLQLDIATPEEEICSARVEMVVLPAIEGQLGILPQHTRLMTLLVPGEMIVHKNGRDEFLAVGDGMVEVTNDRVSIATNMAIESDKIDEAAAEEARRRAAARLEEKLSAEELASVNASLAHSLVQLRVKRRQH